MNDLYLKTTDGKAVKWEGVKRVTEPIFELSQDNKEFHFGDICEFHCEAESDTDLFQQLADEASRQTLGAFDVLEKAAINCLRNQCDICPIKQGDDTCQDWIEENIQKLIENQRRLYLQMTKDRMTKNDAG
ncbi:MAG: hypothetical protein IJI57_04430 [Flexilinea sp.]|nr:hypothetical protein [Flexilinea sp.]